MSRNIENHDSVLLLQDCIAGCKMALESMDDISEHEIQQQLRELIDKYYDEHTGLSVDTSSSSTVLPISTAPDSCNFL